MRCQLQGCAAAVLKVNGKSVTVEAEPVTALLWVQREQLRVTGTQYGSGIAQCGACTLHLDGVAVRACMSGVRAQHSGWNAAELEESGLYLAWRSRGLLLEALAVRP